MAFPLTVCVTLGKLRFTIANPSCPPLEKEEFDLWDLTSHPDTLTSMKAEQLYKQPEPPTQGERTHWLIQAQLSDLTNLASETEIKLISIGQTGSSHGNSWTFSLPRSTYLVGHLSLPPEQVPHHQHLFPEQRTKTKAKSALVNKLKTLQIYGP